MKTKTLKTYLSILVAFSLALSSCDKKNALLVNRRTATFERIKEIKAEAKAAKGGDDTDTPSPQDAAAVPPLPAQDGIRQDGGNNNDNGGDIGNNADGDNNAGDDIDNNNDDVPRQKGKGKGEVEEEDKGEEQSAPEEPASASASKLGPASPASKPAQQPVSSAASTTSNSTNAGASASTSSSSSSLALALATSPVDKGKSKEQSKPAGQQPQGHSHLFANPYDKYYANTVENSITNASKALNHAADVINGTVTANENAFEVAKRFTYNLDARRFDYIRDARRCATCIPCDTPARAEYEAACDDALDADALDAEAADAFVNFACDITAIAERVVAEFVKRNDTTCDCDLSYAAKDAFANHPYFTRLRRRQSRLRQNRKHLRPLRLRHHRTYRKIHRTYRKIQRVN